MRIPAARAADGPGRMRSRQEHPSRRLCRIDRRPRRLRGSATLPESAGFGPSPQLPPPHATLIPTVNIAPIKGWPEGATPVAAPGLRVAAFAESLDHPRWLYVLANGDVLVAETNAPAKPDDNKGIKGWITGLMMGRAGAGVPSANRITLLLPPPTGRSKPDRSSLKD